MGTWRQHRVVVVLVVAGVAGVAVAALAVVLLGRHLSGPSAGQVTQRSPSPSTSTGPGPSASPSRQSATSPALSAVAPGSPPRVSYAVGHTVHLPDGSTAALPSGSGRVAEFTPYAGGWLVVSGGTLRRFDGRGQLLMSGSGGSLAVSLDGTVTAFLVEGRLHVGPSRGVAGVESVEPVHAAAGALAGFLHDGGIVYDSSEGRVRALGRDAKGNRVDRTVSNLAGATATSYVGDLVAGRISEGAGRVVSASSGQTSWTAPGWQLLAFSPDGRYVAAANSPTGGDYGAIGILDAHTGKVKSSMALLGNGLSVDGAVAWEDDDSLLFPAYEQSKRTWAILRLSLDGTVHRATDVTRSPGDRPPFVFATRP